MTPGGATGPANHIRPKWSEPPLKGDTPLFINQGFYLDPRLTVQPKKPSQRLTAHIKRYKEGTPQQDRKIEPASPFKQPRTELERTHGSQLPRSCKLSSWPEDEKTRPPLHPVVPSFFVFVLRFFWGCFSLFFCFSKSVGFQGETTRKPTVLGAPSQIV